MLEQIKQILQGWKNSILKNNTQVEIEAVRRMDICSKCEWITLGKDIDIKKRTIIQKIFPDNLYCNQTKSEIIEKKEIFGCSCPLDKKIRSKESKCPRNLW